MGTTITKLDPLAATMALGCAEKPVPQTLEWLSPARAESPTFDFGSKAMAVLQEQLLGQPCMLRGDDAVWNTARIIGVLPQAQGVILLVQHGDDRVTAIDPAKVRFAPSCKAAPKIAPFAEHPFRRMFADGEYRNWGILPRINQGQWSVEAPGTKRYNCIAHSVHNDQEWVWPGSTVAVFDKFYGDLSYQKLTIAKATEQDFRLTEGIEKVVLFADPAKNDAPTHAIYQNCDGSWSSKNGALEQVRTETPHQLSAGLYGDPYRVYFRPRDPALGNVCE